MDLTILYNVNIYKHKKESRSMKSISEILGGCQLVFGLSFDIQQVFEGILTFEHRAFIKILQVIEEFLACIRKQDRSAWTKRL